MAAIEDFMNQRQDVNTNSQWSSPGLDGSEIVVELGADRALFSISVAAELTGVNPQMLRFYEQKGLLDPHRTEGGTRRYSQRELDRIGTIASLLADGLNMAGITSVLSLQAENERLREELRTLRTT
jgi:MerR family transcriptional regulator/heat shock protein HspR